MCQHVYTLSSTEKCNVVFCIYAQGPITLDKRFVDEAFVCSARFTVNHNGNANMFHNTWKYLL